MFGNNGITSTWGQNNNNNQQQQQQPSAFGQPGAFGSTGFGSTTGTSAFGQPSQPANPMFGGLGGGSSTTPSSFGAFGGTSNQNNAVNPMFVGAKPATGFGAFGGGSTSAFGGGGGTSAFGQTSNTGTSFGQPASNTGTPAFGGGNSSIFGQNKATSAFGATTTPSSQPVTTGSSNPPYAATTEKDTTTNTNLQYQAISCMPAYQGTSLEELRFQDYQQNRKAASTNAFGQTAFGGTQSASSSSVFGQNTQQNTQTNPIFGTRPANPGFGAFGQGNQGTTGTPSSIFGGGTNNTTNAFQPQQTSAFGTFGQPQPQQQQQQQQPQTGSIFGNTGAGGAFGPAGGAFGSGTTGTFGQNTQQPQQTTVFGQPQNASTGTTGGFGVFGNTANANKPSIFGQPTGQPNQPATAGFGGNIFGNQANQQQQNPTPSLFGNTGGSTLFGTNTNQPQQPGGTSIFGNPQSTGTTSGSLFGGGGFGVNNQNQQQQQQNQQPATSAFGGGGLFSGANKPVVTPGTGLFGPSFGTQQSVNNQGGGLFGNSLNQATNQPQQSTLGGGFFGTKPPALGQSTSNGGNAGLFGSPFGASTNTLNASAAIPGAQGTLTASISRPIGDNLPIFLFSMLPPGPRAIDLEQSTKKKPSFFVDMPTRSPVPHMGYTPTNSKLRGFGPSPTKSGIFNISTNGNALALSRSQSPSIFSGSPASPSLGSGQRKSVKKLILDKKVEPTDLFIKSSESPGKIVFSPALGISVREKEAATLLTAPPAKSPTPPRPSRTPNKFTASQNNASVDDSGDLQEGDYYVKPELTTLKNVGYDQLTSFKDLVVGRVGYGEIHFLEPVDLTGLPKLGALLGEVLRFEEKECSVYPDSEEVDKPPPGSGLNVRARIILRRCWAIGKAHREPIKDENNPVAIKHLKRLKGMKDTHFESFDISDGTWTFTVDHF